MEGTVSRVSGLKRMNIFGVRHLSPASSAHLLTRLNELKPKCVLIEGPSDCGEMLSHIALNGVKPPIALLCYTEELPVRTILYPFAGYSPEYLAIRWAFENGAEARFIDLPASSSVLSEALRRDEEPKGESYYEAQSRFYSDSAEKAGEPDYETFWERHFEHCADPDAFAEKMGAFSGAMRESLEDLQWEDEMRGAAYNRVREAYMKRSIYNAISDGYGEDEILAVTGAYHVGGLLDDALAPMTDDEIKALPKTPVKMTLMPYSYYRLSSRSGYGAGNKAPAYFELMWDCIRKKDMERLAPLYLSALGETMREAGSYNSTASVIEAVRLANALTAMHGGAHPTLKDLHDSAVCLMGGGELSAVSEAIARVDIGTEIGELPEGVSQTSVQDDLNRQLKRLRLEKYKSVVAQDIELDLRENRRVQSVDAAYLDLNRSIFFNRLMLLNISFAGFAAAGPSAWSERWVLKWSPEAEIEVVEATLKGETIENAAAFVLKERFDGAQNILEIAKLMRTAFTCKLLSETPNGLMRLQALCVEGQSFTDAAFTAMELANIIRFRDVRNIDPEPLIPILRQVFLRAALIMFDGASCDDEAAGAFIAAMDAMHTISQEHFENVDDAIWLKELKVLGASDNRNAKISGVATAILMERGEISDEELRSEVSRRLSYGVPGDLAALWFEGLSARNRWALLSRANIWRQLDEYIETLDSDEFKRALVFLRRAFSSFDPKEKNAVTDILADIWNIDAAGIGELLRGELTEDETARLEELNDFDFDF